MYDDFWLGSGRLAVLADWTVVADYSARDTWRAELHVMRVYVHSQQFRRRDRQN